MKSTLKRKLRVRKTVSREAHGISNVPERTGWSAMSTDLKDCLGVALLRCHCVDECSDRLKRPRTSFFL